MHIFKEIYFGEKIGLNQILRELFKSGQYLYFAKKTPYPQAICAKLFIGARRIGLDGVFSWMFSFLFDTMHLDWSIVYIEGTQDIIMLILFSDKKLFLFFCFI